MKVETAFETARPGAMISTGCAQKKMVEEHVDYCEESTAWGAKFQRTKRKRVGNVETVHGSKISRYALRFPLTCRNA